MKNKSCCFIGHRKIRDEGELSSRVKEVIQRLLVEKGVRVFNFGSRSEFDELCHRIVTELQGEYPDLLRVNYPCKSEYVVKTEEKPSLEKTLREVAGKNISLREFEQSKTSTRILKAGKACYVERNQDMIDDSDYCVFYYKQEDTPAKTSGTKLAYDYAVKREKIILNVAGTP